MLGEGDRMIARTASRAGEREIRRSARRSLIVEAHAFVSGARGDDASRLPRRRARRGTLYTAPEGLTCAVRWPALHAR
jgi:hypothetical protein